MKRKRCSKCTIDLHLKRIFKRGYKIHGLKLWISFYWLKNWNSSLRYRFIQNRYWNTEEMNSQYQTMSFLTFCFEHNTLTADIVNELFQNVEPQLPYCIWTLNILLRQRKQGLVPFHMLKCSSSKTAQSQWELCMLIETFKYYKDSLIPFFKKSYEYQ